MNEDLKNIKNRFGENMINYYEMKNILQTLDAYKKNDLKIKTIILTDDAILEMSNLIKEEKEIILDKNIFKIDKVIRKNINPLTSNYIIMLKLVNLDIVTSEEISSCFIIKEVDVYLKEFTKKNMNITRKIVRGLLNSNLNRIKREFDIRSILDYDYTTVNEYTYKLTKTK